MDKRKEMLEMLDRINFIQTEKHRVISTQNYVEAASLRDEEIALIEKMDKIGGIKDCYKKIYSTEKILQHLENITESTKELKKLRPEFKEVFENLDFDKYLLKLYRERDAAYLAVLQVREYLEIDEKKLEK